MKTLLLMSSGSFFTEQAPNILPEIFNQAKIAYVTTASKGVEDKSYMVRHIQRMKELNFNFEKIDIEGMDETSLEKALANKNIVYVEGGNTFYLLKAARESGFDKVIKKKIDEGLVYSGASAGAYLACPSIEMAGWKDPDAKKYDRCGLTDFVGLNLVPFLMFAHYVPDREELLKEKVKEAEYPIKILTNGQALMVQDGKITLLGDQEEIKIN